MIEQAVVLATFNKELADVTIISGNPTRWILPEIFDGNTWLEAVTVEFEPIYDAYFNFDEDSFVFSYDGEAIEGLESQLKTQVQITLANSAGESHYTQSLYLTAPVELPGATNLEDTFSETANDETITIEVPNLTDCGDVENEDC